MRAGEKESHQLQLNCQECAPAVAQSLPGMRAFELMGGSPPRLIDGRKAEASLHLVGFEGGGVGGSFCLSMASTPRIFTADLNCL
jgi:hypothetical protein